MQCFSINLIKDALKSQSLRPVSLNGIIDVTKTKLLSVFRGFNDSSTLSVLIDAGYEETVVQILMLFPNEIPYGLDIVFNRWLSGDNSRDYFKPQGRK